MNPRYYCGLCRKPLGVCSSVCRADRDVYTLVAYGRLADGPWDRPSVVGESDRAYEVAAVAWVKLVVGVVGVAVIVALIAGGMIGINAALVVGLGWAKGVAEFICFVWGLAGSFVAIAYLDRVWRD